jgi:hypothetical protein
MKISCREMESASFLQFLRKGSQSAAFPIFFEALEVHHPKQLQDDEDHCDDDQNVNPTACFREPRADFSAEEAEQPQDYQNYDDCPQHKIPPFE